VTETITIKLFKETTMRRFVLSVFALTVLAACQPAATEFTEEQRTAIAETVNGLMAEYWDAERSADYDRARGHIHDSPETVYACPKGRLFHPFEVFDSRSREVWGSMVEQDVQIAESRTTVLAQNVASVMQRGTFAVTDTSGVVMPETNFAFTALWVRQEGDWKMLQMHRSGPQS
jgi:hypothetical protein